MNNTSSALRTWLERLPKAELHLHLEGAIPHDALWVLVEKYGGDPSVPTRASLEQRFTYQDFPHFIQTWIWQTRFLREYEDFTWIAEAVARDLARQHIYYAEVFHSPGDFARHGLQIQPLIEAVRQGLNRVPEIEVGLVIDLVRDNGPQVGMRRLSEIAEIRDRGVIGIGIGGSEQHFPPEPYADVYTEARRLGFRTSAHAGEVAGAASVWGAVLALKVDRIGHGTHAEEDPALIEHLATHQIPIELCPISNVRTGSVARIEAHPARRYVDAGLLVSINTDDPAMFGNSLVDEYAALIELLGFTPAEIRELILNGLRGSWLPADRQQQLLASFLDDPAMREVDDGRWLV
jgi:adenosine deaminase